LQSHCPGDGRRFGIAAVVSYFTNEIPPRKNGKKTPNNESQKESPHSRFLNAVFKGVAPASGVAIVSVKIPFF